MNQIIQKQKQNSIANMSDIPISENDPIVCEEANIPVNVASAEIILACHDQRPYAPVEIDDEKVLGLLDSGAQVKLSRRKRFETN